MVFPMLYKLFINEKFCVAVERNTLQIVQFIKDIQILYACRKIDNSQIWKFL